MVIVISMKSMRLFLVLSLTILLEIIVNGQETVPISQFRLSLGINAYQPLKINNTGERLIKSKPMPAPAGQISFHQEIANNFSVNIGVGLEFDPYCIGYNFDSPDKFNSGPSDPGMKNFDKIWIHQAMYTVPLGIEKSIRNSVLKSLELGLKYNYLVAYPYEISSGVSYQAVDGKTYDIFRYQQFETKQNFITYYIKVGVLDINKKKSLRLNAVAQYSPDAIGTGSYKFMELGFESYGTTKQRNNYIGVELVYGLTLMKRYVR